MVRLVRPGGMQVHVWQLQEAKARLSEVVRLSSQEGPQSITSRGEEVAVVISIEDYNKLIHQKEDFFSFMQNSPLKGLKLSPKRDKSSMRPVDL